MLSQQSNFQSENKLNSSDLQQEIIEEGKKMGFTRYAETLNGRLAMLGFTTLLALAVLNKHGLIIN